MTEPSDAPVVRVRPRTGLLWTAVLTLLLVTSPLYGALYWFAIPHGQLLPTLSGHIVIVLVGIAIGMRQLAVFAEVRGGLLRGNGIFSPLIEVEVSRIASVDLVATYVGLRPNPVQQLLVRDASGRRLFRMRGNFWPASDLVRLAAALPVPTTVTAEPIDVKDFFRRYPGSAYWFENRPAVTAVGIVLGLAAVAAVAAGAIALAGEPFAI
ncbi:hypothetical protein GCM10009840_01350 [Pseudolysinimonas kribbensis]|uniref:PH domain-containing protein n=1 Tax=Pseudolysinimonas kribbensis TaxID=433641 RepID=A0ABQ6K269_9MICO|nr:hypothetical protein [Pseudolysinimonas kribbensis]GMA94409.1 hypothetical protein GCM10025881_12330 [Pseudolysinimonas kribbensis]